jgi:hypothetical protein
MAWARKPSRPQRDDVPDIATDQGFNKPTKGVQRRLTLLEILEPIVNRGDAGDLTTGVVENFVGDMMGDTDLSH